MPLDQFYKVRPGDVGLLGEKMGRAFAADPLCRYIFPDPADLDRRARYFYEFVIRISLTYGEVYAPSAALEGVCCWLPPAKVHIGIPGYLRAGALRAIFQTGPANFLRIDRVGNWLGERHHRFAPGPHYYLAFIGVDPACQGRGFGSALMRPMFERFDAEGTDCYLETHTAANADLYRRFGFDVVDAAPIPGTELTQWSLLRPARRSK